MTSFAFGITFCKECFSESLTWDCRVISLADVQDGRLRYSELTTEYFLGCDYCSETLAVVSSDTVLKHLNNIQGS